MMIILKRFDYSSRLNSNIELYTLLNNPVLLKDNSIICSFSFNNKEYNIEKKLELNQSTTSDTLHKLFLKSYIDANPNFSSEELAIKYQILTNDTAFYCLFQENNLTDEELLNKKYREIENIPPIEHLIKKKEKTKKRYREIESSPIKKSLNYSKKKIKDIERYYNRLNSCYSSEINENDLMRAFSENYENNNLNTIFEMNQSFGHYKNNSQIFPNLPELINIKVILDNNYSFIYKIIGLNRVIKETASEMIINVCKKLKIYDNFDEYNFYYEEKNSLEGNKLNYLVYNIFGEEGTLKKKKKKKYINILKDQKIIINKEKNKVNDENILKEKIYKINKKKRKKGLNNYSQIIHYYNNIHNQKIKDKNRMSNNSNRIYLPKFGQKVEKNPFCNNNKINLNKTQENIEIKSIKKYISLSHLFERKTELNKENNKNDINLNRSLIYRNNSLPNFDFKLSQNNNVINEDNYKIIKSNGKFLPKNILCKDKKIK